MTNTLDKNNAMTIIYSLKHPTNHIMFDLPQTNYYPEFGQTFELSEHRSNPGNQLLVAQLLTNTLFRFNNVSTGKTRTFYHCDLNAVSPLKSPIRAVKAIF